MEEPSVCAEVTAIETYTVSGPRIARGIRHPAHICFGAGKSADEGRELLLETIKTRVHWINGEFVRACEDSEFVYNPELLKLARFAMMLNPV